MENMFASMTSTISNLGTRMQFQRAEIMKNQILMLGQLLMLCGILFCFAIYYSVDFFYPGFFQISISDIWLKTNDIGASLMNYKWMFIWGAGMAVVSLVALPRVVSPSKVFLMDTITSLGAGLMEELGYRCAFIFTAMIALFWSDFLFKFMIVLFSVVIAVAIVNTVIAKAPTWFHLSVVAAGAGGGIWLMLMMWDAHPIYWFYENIVFWFMSLISFGYLDSILYNPNFPFLFIAAAITANAKFRDGHKYQGPVGYINSWIIGFVMIHIMMFHGLLVAIIAHAIYDLSFDVLRLLTRSIRRVAS